MERRQFLRNVAAFAVVSGCDRPSKAADADVPKTKAYLLSPEEQAMIDKLPFKRVTVAGAQALSEWQRLRALGEGWPVVIGGDEAISRIAEQIALEDAKKPAAILAKAATMRHPESLARHRAAETARWKAYEKSQGNIGEIEDTPPPTVGVWPEAPPGALGLEVANDILSQKPYDQVHILIIPTQHGYEVPAYLNWGGWNECPPPAIHVAALRRWHQDYGAELIGISGDVINLRVTKRPATRGAALALSHDQYLYCADIVDQGVETISNLAAGLMNSDWWYFWWD
jgi:hypothetical protein